MITMLVIVGVVVCGSLVILGVLVGASIHREAMRRERRRMAAERELLEDDRERFERHRRAVPGL